MNCQEARDFFEQPDNPELRAHVKGCEDCARELAAWQQMNRLLAEMPRDLAPADIFDSVMKVVAAEPVRKQQPLAGIDWIGSGGLALAAASVAVFLLQQLPPIAMKQNIAEYLPVYQHHLMEVAQSVMQSGGIAQGLIWSVVGLAIAYAFQEGTDLILLPNR